MHKPSPWPRMLPTPQLCHVVYSSFSFQLKFYLHWNNPTHPNSNLSTYANKAPWSSLKHLPHLQFHFCALFIFNTICLPRETESCRAQGLLLAASYCPAQCWTCYRHPIHLWGASQMGLVVKNPPANAGDIRDVVSIPGLWRSPIGVHGNPLQYSCLENPVDGGGWWARVHKVAKNWTWLNWPSMHTHTWLFTFMLFVVARNCKQPRYPSTGKWTDVVRACAGL